MLKNLRLYMEDWPRVGLDYKTGQVHTHQLAVGDMTMSG